MGTGAQVVLKHILESLNYSLSTPVHVCFRTQEKFIPFLYNLPGTKLMCTVLLSLTPASFNLLTASKCIIPMLFMS